jgi:hypothetical protein
MRAPWRTGPFNADAPPSKRRQAVAIHCLPPVRPDTPSHQPRRWELGWFFSVTKPASSPCRRTQRRGSGRAHSLSCVCAPITPIMR